MRDGFEAITIKIKTDDKRALERRCLEHPQYGRWNGPRSYADLVRQAIAQFLAADPQPSSQAKLGAALDRNPPFPYFVHRYRASTDDDDESESLCGLKGLRDESTTNIREDVTCSRCKAIQASNERAFEDAAKSVATDKRRAAKRAPKKAAKKARRR